MTMQPRPGRATDQSSESSTGGIRTVAMLVCLAGVALSLVAMETSVGNPSLHFLQIVPLLLAGGLVVARPVVGANLVLGVLGFWLLVVAWVTLALSVVSGFEFNPFTHLVYLAIAGFSAVGMATAFGAGRPLGLGVRVGIVLGGFGLQGAFLFARLAAVSYL